MSVTSLKVFERECCYLHCWLSQFILACLLVDSVLCASTKLKRHCVCCVSVLLWCVSVCVWLSSWLLVTMNELCVYGWVGSPWLLVTVHCLQNGLVSSKSSLSQQRNRADAITTATCGDFLRFCEKKVMISAITETKRGQKGGFLGSSHILKLSETL